jgi:hypothetical protein
MVSRRLAAVIVTVLCSVAGAAAPGWAGGPAEIWPWAEICAQGQLTARPTGVMGVKLHGWVRACPDQDAALVARARHGIAIYKAGDDGRLQAHVVGTRTLASATGPVDFVFALPVVNTAGSATAICLVGGASAKSRLHCVAEERTPQSLGNEFVPIPTDDPRVSAPVTDIVEDGRGPAPFCGDCLWPWPRVCAKAAFDMYVHKGSSMTLQGSAEPCPDQNSERVEQARYGLAVYRTNADGTRTGYLYGTRLLRSDIQKDFIVSIFNSQPDWPTEALCLVAGPEAAARLDCLAIEEDPVLLEPVLVPISPMDARVDAPIGWVVRDGIGAAPFCGSCV